MSPSHLLGNACHDNDAYHISDAYAISHTLISQTASLLDESLLAYECAFIHTHQYGGTEDAGPPTTTVQFIPLDE